MIDPGALIALEAAEFEGAGLVRASVAKMIERIMDLEQDVRKKDRHNRMLRGTIRGYVKRLPRPLP